MPLHAPTAASKMELTDVFLDTLYLPWLLLILSIRMQIVIMIIIIMEVFNFSVIQIYNINLRLET